MIAMQTFDNVIRAHLMIIAPVGIFFENLLLYSFE